jgi:hypothetical protein
LNLDHESPAVCELIRSIGIFPAALDLAADVTLWSECGLGGGAQGLGPALRATTDSNCLSPVSPSFLFFFVFFFKQQIKIDRNTIATSPAAAIPISSSVGDEDEDDVEGEGETVPVVCGVWEEVVVP